MGLRARMQPAIFFEPGSSFAVMPRVLRGSGQVYTAAITEKLFVFDGAAEGRSPQPPLRQLGERNCRGVAEIHSSLFAVVEILFTKHLLLLH